jgi:hypothetical protein
MKEVNRQYLTNRFKFETSIVSCYEWSFSYRNKMKNRRYFCNNVLLKTEKLDNGNIHLISLLQIKALSFLDISISRD